MFSARERVPVRAPKFSQKEVAVLVTVQYENSQVRG
jgi:hypothetical protein